MKIRFLGQHSEHYKPRRNMLRKEDIPEWVKNRLLGLKGEKQVNSVEIDDIIIRIEHRRIKKRSKKTVDRYLWDMQEGFIPKIVIKDTSVSSLLIYDTLDTIGEPEEEEDLIETIEDFIEESDGVKTFKNGKQYYYMDLSSKVLIKCNNVEKAIDSLLILLFSRFSPKFFTQKVKKMMIRLVIRHIVYDSLKCGKKIKDDGFFRNRLSNSLENCFGKSKITKLTIIDEMREFYGYFLKSKSYICNSVNLRVMMEV